MRTRGFEIVRDEFRKNKEVDIKLPIRADKGSAGYDIYTPITVEIQPNHQVLIWTDVKTYMQEDEVLYIHVRSSIGVKKGLRMANVTGIIDSTYYENQNNDGNIGICLKNTSDKVVILEAGERIAQGVFHKYLVADNDEVMDEERKGGFGSSGQ